jgi:serine/threonine protein kinase
MKYNEIHKSQTLLQCFKRESKALLTLKGDHVLGAYEIIDENPPSIYVISELCNGGDLRKLMNKRHGQPYPEKEAIKIFSQML